MNKKMVRLALLGVLALVGCTFGAGALTAGSAERGYGHCSRCSCPGYRGSGYTCTRGGCAHHYDLH